LPLHSLFATSWLLDPYVAKVQKFLLAQYPAAAAIEDSNGMTPYQLAIASQPSAVPTYISRFLLSATPELYPHELRDVIYEDRRGAMYLLFVSEITLGSEMAIWQRLRSHGDRHLFREIVSYL
jgi:hypothetical protein